MANHLTINIDLDINVANCATVLSLLSCCDS